jgi:hypothetical protein
MSLPSSPGLRQDTVRGLNEADEYTPAEGSNFNTGGFIIPISND